VSAIGKGIRWLLVPVSAAAVVAACAAAARWSITIVDRSCPAASMAGGACVEPWHTTAVEASIYIGVGLAALGVVVLPSLIAPQLKRTISIVAFGAATGVTVAAYFRTGWADLLMLVAVAVVSGGIGLWWVWSRRLSNDRV
jgi:hypothetical protein